MDNNHLTAPMLSASMDEVIRLRERIEVLEAALREIVRVYDTTYSVEHMYNVARAALDKDAGQ